MGERDVRNVEASGSIPLTSTRFDGAIAQLGERLHGMQEVGSSILPGSTMKKSGNPRRSRKSDAGVAQLVERNLAKVEVASSNLVSRSKWSAC